MILEQLTLYNFCLYRGEQIFELSPTRKNGTTCPIVLFGGINGGGKTTLLDAVRLALYGARANVSKRAASYDAFLRDCIHRSVDPREGAAVGLSFRYALEGEEHLYEVRRVWSGGGKTLREKIHVSRDGELDPWMSENWNELIDELIPIGISQLFFFDAEKIRLLAEDETTDQTLGGAIKSLLGLDLAERLIADADVLESRLAQNLSASMDDTEIARLEEQREAKEAEIRIKRSDRAALENDRRRAENEAREAEEQFAKIGGPHWQQRESRERDRVELKNREEQLESQLVALAATEMPLALIMGLLDEVANQDAREHAAVEETVVYKLLSQRDSRLLRDLKQNDVPKEAINVVRRLQQADRNSRKKLAGEPRWLKLSENARNLLAHIREHGLAQQTKAAGAVVEQLADVRRKRDSIERALKATPQEDQVRKVVTRLTETTRQEAVLNEQASRLDAEIHSLTYQRDEMERQLKKLRRKQVDMDIRGEETARIAKLAIRTQEAMKEFLRRATSDKIDRLSGLVTTSFRYLLRKQSLVDRVQIDPQSFAITLFDEAGIIVPRQRLSEGEKQIFAVSLLWGLAQASPRSLPAIIDTPMARLDSVHRQYLIDRYFPNASHQVIILSTDTEVDQQAYRDLKQHVARTYHLKYDEQQKVTLGEIGYFAWQDELELT